MDHREAENAANARLLIPLLSILPTGNASTPFPMCAVDALANSSEGHRYPHSLAILGTPGSGKSTLGTQLACLAATKLNISVAIIGMEQTATDIRNLAEMFGWDAIRIDNQASIKFCSADVFPPERLEQTSLGAPNTGSFSSDKSSGRDQTGIEEVLSKHRLVVLDGICSFYMPSDEKRLRWVRFLKMCREKMTFPILIGDEPSGEDHFLEYLVDAVFRLEADGPWRYLRLPKVRYMKIAHPGPHILKIHERYTESEHYGGVEIIPSPFSLLRPRLSAMESAAGGDLQNFDAPLDLDTTADSDKFGVEGYEKLFPDSREGGALNSAESILLAGNPGTGKTLLMLKFLEQAAPKKAHQPLDALTVFIDRDPRPIVETWKQLTKKNNPESVDRFCKERISQHAYKSRELRFITATSPPEEIAGTTLLTLDHFAKQNKPIRRIVIVGLEALFDVAESVADRRRLASAFLSALRNRNVLSLFVYEIPGWFTSLGTTPTKLFELFDTTLITGMREEMNRVVPCIHAIRSRGRGPTGPLVRLKLEKEGPIIDNTPWSKAGLVSGDPAAVLEPSIFVKLFFENPSELFVNRVYLDKLKGRYKEANTFTLVFKEMPTPDHFSFRGYGGAGHSNLKILLLRKTVLDDIAYEDRIENLENLIPESFKAELKRSIDPAWKRCRDTWQWNMIPCYLDMATLVGNHKWMEKYNVFKDFGIRDQIPHIITVEELNREKVTFQKKHGTTTDRPKYFLTLPSLTGRNRSAAVALLLGLIDSYSRSPEEKLFPIQAESGTNRGKKPSRPPEGAINHYRDIVEMTDGPLDRALKALFELVDGHLVPNPLDGRNYQDSVFSWRWSTCVEDYTNDESAFLGLEEKPIYKFRHVVADKLKGDNGGLNYRTLGPLVGSEQSSAASSPSIVGELYCLAVLKGALAPETGWYLIHDLIQPFAPDLRIAFRRGWPTRKTHFLPAYREGKLREEDGKWYDYYVTRLSEDPKPTQKKGSVLLMSDYPESFKLENALLTGLKVLFIKRRDNASAEDAIAAAKDAILKSPPFFV
ncbi:MAG: ATPase domain-containing protein [Myxococcota bacterium]|nr:ATPase domain-containing protein [Myxococcota bacterium]